MRFGLFVILASFLFLLVGCQDPAPVCPPVKGTPEYITVDPDDLPTPTQALGQSLVEIGRRQILVDKVVEGSLCNGEWSGTVYVTCNVQVYEWNEEPTFLKNCQLNIDPGAVVYVAYHNNTAYYTGCSCHTGIKPEP